MWRFEDISFILTSNLWSPVAGQNISRLLVPIFPIANKLAHGLNAIELNATLPDAAGSAGRSTLECCVHVPSRTIENNRSKGETRPCFRNNVLNHFRCERSDTVVTRSILTNTFSHTHTQINLSVLFRKSQPTSQFPFYPYTLGTFV